ncbi:MAG: pyruvate kinase [Armatimonadetes bacterium]|nr:pyruvate kinase [Armatimonadota bacterium]
MARRTKIVCTLGPASSGQEAIEALTDAGMNVARLNFSHGTHAFHRANIEAVRAVAEERGIAVGVLQDLPGPKIRIGALKGGSATLETGRRVRFEADVALGDAQRIGLPHPEILVGMSSGTHFYLADGMLDLRVLAKDSDGVTAEVVVGGVLRSHKGVNVPDSQVALPPATTVDLEHLRFGMEAGVDWVAVSFVASPQDVIPFREAARSVGSRVRFLAKIERKQALDHLDEIIAAFDGVMVARGDLGIEIPIQQVPLIQKEIIKKCRAAGKPVIVATQMLMSMVDSPRPTRAEAADIANAILDGTDAVMLSEETAIGRYPVECVQTMAQVAEQAEEYLLGDSSQRGRTRSRSGISSTDAIAMAAATMAEELDVKAIISCTATGATARAVSKQRPSVPVLASVSAEFVRGQLALSWGVRPYRTEGQASMDDMISTAVKGAIDTGVVNLHDWVIIIAGVRAGVPGNTSLIKYHRVGDSIG